jgi:hypothetical protein
MIYTDHHSGDAFCTIEATADDRNAADSFYESPTGLQEVAGRPATALTPISIGGRRAAAGR